MLGHRASHRLTDDCMPFVLNFKMYETYSKLKKIIERQNKRLKPLKNKTARRQQQTNKGPMKKAYIKKILLRRLRNLSYRVFFFLSLYPFLE
jgi:transposase